MLTCPTADAHHEPRDFISLLHTFVAGSKFFFFLPAAYAFQANVSVIVLFLDSNSVAEAVLDSVKRQRNIEEKTIVWIAPDYWGTSSYFLQGMFAQ